LHFAAFYAFLKDSISCICANNQQQDAHIKGNQSPIHLTFYFLQLLRSEKHDTKSAAMTEK